MWQNIHLAVYIYHIYIHVYDRSTEEHKGLSGSVNFCLELMEVADC